MTARRPAPRIIDAGLAVATTVAVLIAISVADEPHSRTPDAGAAAIAVLIGGVLLLRRRWPLAVLLASAMTLMLYYVAEYPGIPPGLPLAAALYSAAAATRVRWAAIVAGGFVLLELVMRHFQLRQSVLPALAATVADGTLLMVVVLLGETVRSRRVRLAEAEERLERQEAVREEEAARRVAEERLRIAREFHDVLGHTITAITVHAGLADDVLDERPAEARAALRTIRATAREAMAEMRVALGLLRTSGTAPVRPPAPGLIGVDALADVARGAGLDVSVTVAGTEVPLPARVELAAYRIIQGALTNTVRHARASRVMVVIAYEPADLAIEVTDDGAATGPVPVGGAGLLGMSERAAAVGGECEAGHRSGGGFRVRARLPLSAVTTMPGASAIDSRDAAGNPVVDSVP